LLAAVGADAEALEPARSAGVIVDVDRDVRFAHPLLGSALYQALGPSERHRVHEKLSQVLEDPLDRARHLALSTDEPDRAVAAALEEAASLAGRRGAPSAAGELGEHAFRRTPAADVADACRRAVAAAHAAGGTTAGRDRGRNVSLSHPHVVGRARGARALLEQLVAEWSERDERFVSQALWYLALVELRAGRLDVAAEHAERSRELSLLYGRDDTEDPQDLFAAALVAAHRGQLEGARDLVEAALPIAEQQRALLPGLDAVLGLVALWSGEPTAAVERFGAAERAASAAGWVDPARRFWRGDYAEALLTLGRSEDAVRVVDAWEAAGTRLGMEWVLAEAARCRGLVAAGRGDLDDARRLLEAAAAKHERVGDRFGRARSLLALGVVLRRARQKRASREAVEEATRIFEACLASGWADKARAELGRVGGRRREEGLTAAERRVAALVAEGRTNREVAAALVLGERTVETHLTHIYAKLGIRSRTELARTLSSKN
jgi:DNA-binding CsgD family transcriptional regulator